MRKLFFIFQILFLLGSLNAKKITIIVSKNGDGNYKTVQEAFNSIPTDNKDWITISVRKGIYKEKLILDTRKNFVHLVGENKDSTILTYNDHAGIKLVNGDTINTWTSASVFIYANDFFAENISFENNAGFKAGQAVAIFVYGDRAKFINCKMLGFQDVLFCSGPSSKQYYKDCYIEGTTDFIFGPATAVFKNCQIHSKKNSHVTAASTPRELPYGFVFFDCNLTADTGLNKVSLGRPWQPFASVTYLHCNIGKHIVPEGWNNWKNPANEKTARYAEYNNYGPGANILQRPSWVKQLTKEEADKYTLKNIFGDWKVE